WGGAALDAVALRRATAWSAPETRLWNDGLDANVRYGSGETADTWSNRLGLAEAGALARTLERRRDPRLGDAGAGLSDAEVRRGAWGSRAGAADRSRRSSYSTNHSAASSDPCDAD